MMAAAARQLQTSASRRLLDGVKAIGAHLGFENLSSRRLETWVREGMPVRRIGRRCVAYADELDGWWAALPASKRT